MVLGTELIRFFCRRRQQITDYNIHICIPSLDFGIQACRGCRDMFGEIKLPKQKKISLKSYRKETKPGHVLSETGVPWLIDVSVTLSVLVQYPDMYSMKADFVSKTTMESQTAIYMVLSCFEVKSNSKSLYCSGSSSLTSLIVLCCFLEMNKKPKCFAVSLFKQVFRY